MVFFEGKIAGGELGLGLLSLFLKFYTTTTTKRNLGEKFLRSLFDGHDYGPRGSKSFMMALVQ